MGPPSGGLPVLALRRPPKAGPTTDVHQTHPDGMTERVVADALVALHLAFIAFVIAGGLLALRHGGWAALHLPAVAWGAWTEFTGTVCPLTPWENSLRRQAGDAGYPGGFIEHYVIPLIYPDALTSRTQIAMGLSVVAINVVVYALVVRKLGRARPPCTE